MKIWIDADAAPREVKELVFRASQRLELEVVLVANQSIGLPPNRGLISGVTVNDGANVADQYIVNHSSRGDVVITADIPLAAQLVEKEVHVIDPRGEVYDNRNIGSRLGMRDWMEQARSAGMELRGPRPYGPQDRKAFAASLDRILTRVAKLSAREASRKPPEPPASSSTELT